MQSECFVSRQRTKLWKVLFILISLVSLRDWWTTGGIPQCSLPPQLLWLPVHWNDLYRAGLFAKYDCNFLLTLNCHFSLDKLCAQILLKTPVVQFYRWYFQTVGIPWIQKDSHYQNHVQCPPSYHPECEKEETTVKQMASCIFPVCICRQHYLKPPLLVLTLKDSSG